MDTESMGDQSKCGDTLYVPEVASNYKPYKGQEFDTLGDAYCFYNKYAEEAGFSTRIHSSKKDRSNEITRKEYVCFKEGNARQSNVVDRKRCRSIIRCGCSAKLAVVKSKLGKYVVSLFVERHNHALSTPGNVQILRSHQSISAAQKCVSQQLHNGQFALQNEMKGHDAELLYEYFQSEHEKNSSFFFNIKSGDDDRITHCFWADAICRRAYKFYGDVVVFDTTYNTNRYDMIFAHFVGVNNHGQIVLFGCGFLNDKTTESFVWLFEQFKEAMPGNDLKMIITSQDLAMTEAISQSFPHTFHRFCIWHILNKFSERLSTVTYREHYRHFKKCIWESNTMEEFDAMWKDIINKATLTDNEWLQGVYKIRSKWVPAYVNHVFSAGMSSSQRAESSHAFFKRYVSKKNSLLDFVVRFNRALSRQRHEELIVDNKNMNERPMLRLPLKIEKQMSDIYTQDIFYKFQDELWNSLLHVIELVRENENCWVYNVVSKKDGVSKVFEVLRDKSSEFFSCICKKFDSEGIPCTHILALFYKLQIHYMTDVYVLKRWTKAAKLERVVDDNGFEINDCSDKSFLFRRTKLFQLVSNLIDKAAFSEEATKICTDSLNGLIEQVNSLIESCTSEGVLEKDSCVQPLNFNEPLQVRDKGCGKRLRGGKETAKDKAKDKGKRRCNGCGEVGQSHDKRNCPLLMKRFRSMVIQERNMNLSDSDNESYYSIDG